MNQAKDILSLERFDTYLDQDELLKNVTNLANYLSKQDSPFPVDQIKPTMTYIIEIEELMGAKSEELQIELAKCFIHAFRISVPSYPFDESANKFIYRIFILLNNVAKQYKNPEQKDVIIELLKIADQIDLYALAKDAGVGHDIYLNLIKIDAPEAIENLAKYVNVSERILPPILAEMYEKIFSNKNVKALILKLNNLKQTEFIQGIRSSIQNISGPERIKIYAEVSKILNVSADVLFNYVQIDISNDDDSTRQAAVKLLTDKFLEIEFDTNNQTCILTLIDRHKDREPKIRVIAVNFAFSTVLKIKELKKRKDGSSVSSDIFNATTENIINEVWSMAEERITDKASEVRLAVMKGINHLDAKDIKLDPKIISYRLKDKTSADIRVVALKVMLKLYDSSSKGFEWLIEQVIELYPYSKDVALYGFATLVSHHSLIEVAENLNNRKPLLDILRDTNEFRTYLPLYEKDKEFKEIISKHIDLKLLNKILKKAPKGFIDNALDPKKRKHINKVLKNKLDGSSARLIMGLYQPSPINVEEILECKDLDVVHDLSKIFADEFEVEISSIIKRLNKTDLTILAEMKKVDFNKTTRSNILKALLPLITNSGSKKSVKDKKILALKAFARLYSSEKGNEGFLAKIKFAKGKFSDKLKFFGHFTDSHTYTKELYKEIENRVKEINSETVKFALRIISTEESQRTVDVHFKLINTEPALTFKSYLLCAHSCFSYISPEIFRSFAYVMQHENSKIRKEVITNLSNALRIPSTPIQFLALFALSATDPSPQNVNEAKKQLESAIQWRRQILKKIKEYRTQIAPETALPYLINILSHHKNFDEDLPELATFSIYLKFFLTPLCENKNYSTIYEIFNNYSMLDDVEEEYTDKMVKLCNLGMVIVKELGQGKEWDNSNNNEDHPFEFSSRYFKQPANDRERIKQIMKQSGIENLKSPTRPKNLLRAGMSPLRSPKLKLTSPDESE